MPENAADNLIIEIINTAVNFGFSRCMYEVRKDDNKSNILIYFKRDGVALCTTSLICLHVATGK